MLEHYAFIIIAIIIKFFYNKIKKHIKLKTFILSVVSFLIKVKNFNGLFMFPFDDSLPPSDSDIYFFYHSSDEEKLQEKEVVDLVSSSDEDSQKLDEKPSDEEVTILA